MWHHHSRGILFGIASKIGDILRGIATEGGEGGIQVKGIGPWFRVVRERCTCAPGGWV